MLSARSFGTPPREYSHHVGCVDDQVLGCTGVIGARRTMRLMKRRERNWLKACNLLAPLFSTCSKRQYAAVILSTEGRLVGFGYNGSPPGMQHCVDGFCPRAQEGSAPGSQYDNCIAQHAEVNAILWSDPAMRRDGTLIVNGPPCMGCAKAITSSGITKLIHQIDPAYKDFPAVSEFLAQAGIRVISYQPASSKH